MGVVCRLRTWQNIISLPLYWLLPIVLLYGHPGKTVPYHSLRSDSAEVATDSDATDITAIHTLR